MAAGQAEGASRNWSDGQPGATFGAARTQDLAAADGLHPGAEPVGPLAPDHRGLVSAFHGFALREKSFVLERLAHHPVKANRVALPVAAKHRPLWITRAEYAYNSLVTGSLAAPAFFLE